MKADELFDDNLNVDTVRSATSTNTPPTTTRQRQSRNPPRPRPTPSRHRPKRLRRSGDRNRSRNPGWSMPTKDGQDSKTDASDDDRDRQAVCRILRYALQRERQRRRELEEELERLREKVDKPDSDDDLDDEEFLTAAQARRLAARAIQEALKQKDQEISRIREAEQVKSRLLACEQAFRSRVPDYDTVVEAALKEDVLTQADRSEAYQAKDPAKALYLAAKQKLSLLGIELPVPKKTTQIETTLSSEQKSQEPDETMSPEALFDSIFK